MLKKYWILLKGTAISPYIWTILSILPFYFIFLSPSTVIKIIGIVLTLSFFLFYRLAYNAKGWTIYIWASILITISVTSVTLFNYVYFAFFLAYFIGNIKNRATFVILYFIHLVMTAAAINFKILTAEPFFIKQLPFILIIFISVILMPFSIRFRKERGQLEEKLEDANKRISEFVKQEERARIARDLHDTLGQKLSLIGLKSDLARKLIYNDPEQARAELKDVQQTARTALNEVRKMVANMRGIRLKDELIHVKEILKAAQITFTSKTDIPLTNISLLTENILSMCLKEAVTNIVKHSSATNCDVSFEQTASETVIKVKDNGRKTITAEDLDKGNGLRGMKERLEFVNGSLEIVSKDGTILIIKVPNTIKLAKREEKK